MPAKKKVKRSKRTKDDPIYLIYDHDYHEVVAMCSLVADIKDEVDTYLDINGFDDPNHQIEVYVKSPDIKVEIETSTSCYVREGSDK